MSISFRDWWFGILSVELNLLRSATTCRLFIGYISQITSEKCIKNINRCKGYLGRNLFPRWNSLHYNFLLLLLRVSYPLPDAGITILSIENGVELLHRAIKRGYSAQCILFFFSTGSSLAIDLPWRIVQCNLYHCTPIRCRPMHLIFLLLTGYCLGVFRNFPILLYLTALFYLSAIFATSFYVLLHLNTVALKNCIL